MNNEAARRGGESPPFDNVVASLRGTLARQPTLACTTCQSTLTKEYYTVNGAPACATCSGKRRFFKAVAFGLGAAVVGATVYYLVIAMFNLEIGLVALLCGFMVGWAVHRGADGYGGRRYQILAVALTYYSVCLAYTPFALKGAREGAKLDLELERATALAQPRDPAEVADSVRAQAIADSITTDSLLAIESGVAPVSTNVAVAVTAAKPAADTGAALIVSTSSSVWFALSVYLIFSWTLPLYAVFGTMPEGLISVVIIGVGMLQAWRMTEGEHPDVAGPFKVGDGAGPASA